MQPHENENIPPRKVEGFQTSSIKGGGAGGGGMFLLLEMRVGGILSL
jgi:hypothetical protein